MPFAHSSCPQTRHLAVALSLALVAVGACNGPEQRGSRTGDTSASMRRLPGTSPDVAFDASVEAIREYFTQAFPSRDLGTVESPMVEYEQRGGTGRFRDTAIGFRNRLRRKATIWVAPAEAGSVVRCQVRVQRLDTADQRTFQSQQQFNDVPNETPIEREAGVDPSKEQAWTELERDTALERELLSVVMSRVERKG
jgi:hypothetical protein